MSNILEQYTINNKPSNISLDSKDIILDLDSKYSSSSSGKLKMNIDCQEGKYSLIKFSGYKNLDSKILETGFINIDSFLENYENLNSELLDDFILTYNNNESLEFHLRKELMNSVMYGLKNTLTNIPFKKYLYSFQEDYDLSDDIKKSFFTGDNVFEQLVIVKYLTKNINNRSRNLGINRVDIAWFEYAVLKIK